MKSLVKALLVFLLLFCLIGSGVLFLSITTNKDKAAPIKQTASFALAAWDFPDEYGQGIESFEVFENSSGSWEQVGGGYGYDETTILEWNVGVAIKLRCYTYFNSTLTGADNIAEGKKYQRHNVSVINIDSTIVFSQQNFTYIDGDSGIDPPLWFYSYEVVLEFLPVEGEYYTVTVGYEIFW